MTDEKPKKDEVSDEQLEGVAGGVFLDTSTSAGDDTSTSDSDSTSNDSKTSTSSDQKLHIDPSKNLN